MFLTRIIITKDDILRYRDKIPECKNPKGCTFARTIIYPTSDLKQYMESNKNIEMVSTKNAIYVALSRAIDSVAIAYDGPVYSNYKIKIWIDDCL